MIGLTVEVLFGDGLPKGSACPDPEKVFGYRTKETVPSEEIIRFGKAQVYADNRPRLLVDTRDGRRGLVYASKQSDKAAGKWLAKLSKQVGFAGLPGKYEPYVTKWIDIPESE